MKKIVLKIVLAIVACSLFGMLTLGIMNLIIASRVVSRNAHDELAVIVQRERLEFEKQLIGLKDATEAAEEVVRAVYETRDREGEVDFEQLKSDITPLLMGISRRFELLDLFIYFNPQLDKGKHLEILDSDRDGVYEIRDGVKVSELPKDGEDYKWYIDSVNSVESWSSPYFMEVYDTNLISYTKTIYSKGQVLGVIGSDLVVDEILDYFNSIKVMTSGGMFLYDRKLNFIIHPELKDKNLKDVDPEVYDILKKKLADGDSYRHINYNFQGDNKTLSYEVMDNGWVLAVAIFEEDILKDLDIMVQAFIFFLIITLILSLVMAFFVGNSISKPIIEVSRGMDRVATGDGDLTHKLDIKAKDEVGELAAHFNTFLEKLKDIVISARKSAVSDQRIGEELLKGVSNSSKDIGEIVGNVGVINKDIADLDSNILNSTSALEDVSASISEINIQVEGQGAAVEQSTAAIEEMIASLNNVVNVTQRKLLSAQKLVETVRFGGEQLRVTNDSFNSGIVKRIDAITEMVEVINSISAQTDLLAMNAAIEAAHAGDSGKGFAVVAEEIRRMAETSAESSKNIAQIIKQIVMSVNETAENNEKTAVAFAETEKEIVEFKIAFEEIASSTSEVSTGGNEILKAVSELNGITSLILEGVKEIDGTASQVKGSMVRVKERSSGVLKGINDISRGTGSMDESLHGISLYTSELKKETASLLEALNRFKT